ncbi:MULTISPECIES: hypothetical protein [Pectobacterium]|uniref:Uncharacterized protein n=1 Tax=Pectobacterium parmentieri TaxID=1905730 RepID=A0A0H3I134_PECPM|nr:MULTISPECIES: hypothetical protein [Pectobacterium]AFI89752.1 Hypothetical protein W5S_1660 [Pectobacterium parmentieri]ASN84968.1 Hypothetical protein SCC1_1529 [Pectobacterium versatile]AYH36019.1 hypothetical protein C5E17_08350 [Pectobacterium parmentieri]MBN3195929.1 hypothetical protein [Pectobacterium versatile]MCA6961650.1 hypothetical protein [Pectobacterium odoriferum]
MNGFFLSISEVHESDNQSGYYIFDCFGNCIGYASSLELAYSLIIHYINLLLKTYKNSLELPENFENIKKERENNICNDKNKTEYVNSILFSLENTSVPVKDFFLPEKLKVNLKFKNKITGNFIFETNQINEVHENIINDLLEKENKEEERKKIISEILSYKNKPNTSECIEAIKKIYQENKSNSIYKRKKTI